MLNSDRKAGDSFEAGLLVGSPLGLATLGLGLALSLLLLVAGHGADGVLHDMSHVSLRSKTCGKSGDQHAQEQALCGQISHVAQVRSKPQTSAGTEDSYGPVPQHTLALPMMESPTPSA